MKHLKPPVERPKRSNLTASGLFFRLTVLAVLLSVSGFSQTPQSAPPPKTQEITPTQPPAEKPQDVFDKDRLSYAFGASTGEFFRRHRLELNSELFIKGLEDAFSDGQTLYSWQEIRAIVGAVQRELQVRQLAEREQAAKVLAEKNKAEGEAFLAKNRGQEGIVTLESGLQYKILRAGEGKRPRLGDTVVCHYRGTLLDGSEFDSSYQQNEPATFVTSQVIPGWTEALQLMPVGSKWQLFIPSSLAYGERGAGREIGPNATLIFEVELLEVKEAPAASGSQPQ